MKNLEGKVALVTGAARNIGLAIASKLASRGARVVLADIDGGAAERAAATLPANSDAIGIGADVGSPDAVRAMMERVDSTYGRVDILVNNAGLGKSAPFLEMSLDDWDRAFRVSLTGAFLVAQAAARRMVASGDGGTIVNITSISGQRGGHARAAYGSAKAGLELLTRVLAVELAQYSIRVNAVAPGPIAPAPGQFWHNDIERAAYTYLIPMRRFGTPEEVADGVLFLASDESRYVTGHILNVDGGFGAAGLMVGAPPPL
ncbi:SDR family NAD(P)-dependent oxidoreductase [Bradyrhizobium sp. 87]|uniref:SDR family NAD(P)-dependent oxidoreductase n=1 Tax=Bradyrhizobium sp. 87 TaxID=2782682 RepID=UPI003211E594